MAKSKAIKHNSQTPGRNASSMASLAAVAGLAHSNIIDRNVKSEGSKSEPVSGKVLPAKDKKKT